MSQHDSLRERKEQHKPKNEKSKQDDKDVYKSMAMVMDYLKNKKEFSTYFSSGCDLEFSHQIEVKYMMDFIKRKGVRKEFNYEFADRTIIPDGGILYLVKNGEKFPLVIAEIKRQGTNKERLQEGKAKQATGNANVNSFAPVSMYFREEHGLLQKCLI